MAIIEFSNEFFMHEALKEARKAFDKDEVPVGAVVVCRNVVIARAHNLTEQLNDVTAHAEMQAITAATAYLGGKYLDGCSLYVTVEPCPMCAAALFWAQLGVLVYGTKDEKRGYRRYKPELLHPKTKIIEGILEDDCRTLMVEFFNRKR